MKLTKFAVGAAAVAMMLTACSGGPPQSAEQKTLTIAMSVAATPWDLAEASGGFNEQQYQPVFDTLLRIQSDGTIVGNLAESYAVTDDKKGLTLKIRGGQKFTDGTAVDAAAVASSLLHTMGGTNEGASNLHEVESIKATDVNTVTIALKAPDPALPMNLSKIAGMIASPKALVKPEVPIGSGPYKLDTVATTAGRIYTYVRNADYWNSKAYPYEKIVIKPMTDPAAKFNALVSGQVDSASIPSAKLAAAKSANLNIATYIPGDVEGVFIFDRAGTLVPALGDVRVRQAINMAFDRAAIIKTAKNGLGDSTTQMFNKTSDAYSPDLNSKYTYDPAKAKALLTAAGYPDGFEITIPDLSAIFPQQQAIINQNLTDIGLKLKLVPLPQDQLFTSLMAGKYALSYFKLESNDPWDTINRQFLATSQWNPFKYSDPKADALIQQAQTASKDEQKTIYQELNTYIVDQAWNAPWDAVAAVQGTAKNVEIIMPPFYSVPPLYSYTPAS